MTPDWRIQPGLKQYTRRCFLAVAALFGGTALIGWSETSRTRAAHPRQPFKTVTDMLADADGPDGAGAIWRAGSYTYAEAPSGVTDSHLQTAGGVKLNVLGLAENVWSAEAFGVSPTNSPSTNDKAMAALRNAAIGKGRDLLHRLVYPKGLIQFTSNRWLNGLRKVIVEAHGTIFQNTNSGRAISVYAPIGPRECMFRVSGESDNVGYFTGHRFTGAKARDAGVTLSTPAEAKHYAKGDLVFLFGFATQRAGYSPNHRFFEWRRVASVTDGVLTFTEKLDLDYDNGWPDFQYSPGGNFGSIELGPQYIGKPRILNLTGRPQGDGTSLWYPEFVHIRGARFRKNPTASTTNRLSVYGYRVILEDVGWEDGDDTSIDQRETYMAEWLNLRAPRGAEPDKLCGSLAIRGGVFGNNPDNNFSISGGTSINNIEITDAQCVGRIGVSPRDRLVVRNSRVSGVSARNAPRQGPIMSYQSGFEGRFASIERNSFDKLSNQRIIGEAARFIRQEIDDVDARAGTIKFQWGELAEPPRICRAYRPGLRVWLEANPRVRGIVSSFVDDGNGYLVMSFSSGDMARLIRTGTVTSSDTVVYSGCERVMLDGKRWN